MCLELEKFSHYRYLPHHLEHGLFHHRLLCRSSSGFVPLDRTSAGLCSDATHAAPVLEIWCLHNSRNRNEIQILVTVKNGLKRRFWPCASACIPCILQKFRERKQNVVIAMREAIVAMFLNTTLESIQQDVLAALENQTPQVKAATASFLTPVFHKIHLYNAK